MHTTRVLDLGWPIARSGGDDSTVRIASTCSTRDGSAADPAHPIRCSGDRRSCACRPTADRHHLWGTRVRAVVLGSGNTPSLGGTVLWELHLKGALLVVISRILPILLATALAWLAAWRLGGSVLEPVPLISLVATSLSFRLVFEQNLFGYYFMALAVLLLILDVVQGRIRGQLVAWLALVVLAFDPVPRFHLLSEYLPSVLMVIVCCLILRGIRRDRVHWYLVAWLLMAAIAFASYPIGNFRYPLPTWMWQIALVSTGVVLAVKPMLLSWRSGALDKNPVLRGRGHRIAPTSWPRLPDD